MQVTKELIENDIRGIEAEVENLKARLAQTIGALTTLQNIKEYMDKPEPEAIKTAVAEPEKVVEEHQVVDALGKYHTVADMETV